MDFGALVCVVHVVIVVQVEFALAIGGYVLVGMAIDGEEPKEIVGRHPPVAMPLFDVDPQVDPWFRFEILKELLLSPPGAMFAGVGEPILAVDSD
jgi:hypothetical protein